MAPPVIPASTNPRPRQIGHTCYQIENLDSLPDSHDKQNKSNESATDPKATQYYFYVGIHVPLLHQYAALHAVLAVRRATQVEVLLAPSLARNVHARATRPTLTVERATPAHAVALNVNIITNLRT